jgi:hypothetical protein
MVTFERKLAEALKSKTEAEEAQRKAESESTDINETVEALLDA